MGAVGRAQVRALAVCAVAVAVACGEAVGVDEVHGDPTVDGGSPAVGTATTQAPEGGAISDGGADAGDTDGADAALQGDGSAPDAALPDDPCPTKLDVNCSTSCGGLMKCDKGCAPSTSTVYTMPAASGSFVLRMPSSPGALKHGELPPICTGACNLNGALAMGFRIVTDAPSARVRVDPPWFIGCDLSCATFAPLSGPNIVGITVYTQDPNAPARNVVVEATSEPCTP